MCAPSCRPTRASGIETSFSWHSRGRKARMQKEGGLFPMYVVRRGESDDMHCTACTQYVCRYVQPRFCGERISYIKIANQQACKHVGRKEHVSLRMMDTRTPPLSLLPPHVGTWERIIYRSSCSVDWESVLPEINRHAWGFA